MNGAIKHHEAYFDHIGSITLPENVVTLCSHQGDCEQDVKLCLQLPEIKAELAEIDPEELRKELKNCGAWTREELADHATNLERILWIAACNIKDDLDREENDRFSDED